MVYSCTLRMPAFRIRRMRRVHGWLQWELLRSEVYLLRGRCFGFGSGRRELVTRALIQLKLVPAHGTLHGSCGGWHLCLLLQRWR